MKHNSFLRVLVATLGMTPLLSFGIGSWSPGTVSINPTYPIGTTAISGHFSVRFNPGVTKGFIALSGGGSSIISVTGQDSTTGVNFYCNIPVLITPTPGASPIPNPLYPHAEKILYGAGNGTRIVAYYNGTFGSQCTRLNADKGSYHLD